MYRVDFDNSTFTDLVALSQEETHIVGKEFRKITPEVMLSVKIRIFIKKFLQ